MIRRSYKNCFFLKYLGRNKKILSTLRPLERTFCSFSNTTKVSFFRADQKLSSPCYNKHVPTGVVIRTCQQNFGTNLPEHTELAMPALSPSMEKGNISKWLKKEGDEINAGDVLAEIETDKATMDFEATDEGYLAKILLQEGSKDVPIGQVIAIIVANKEDVGAFKGYESQTQEQEQAPKPAAESRKETDSQTTQITTSEDKTNTTKSQQRDSDLPNIPGVPPKPLGLPKSGYLSSPLARATAQEKGIDVSSVQGSGPMGRVIQEDILKHTPQSASQVSQVPSQYEDIPNSQIRKITAERLTMSKQTIPHYYLSIETKVDKLLSLRKSLNDRANGEYKLSVNDFVIKAAALSLKKIPIVNSSWSNDSIRTYHNVDINVAVNTEKGLFTPIVHDADKLGLAAINNTVKQLALKAKENKLQPQDFMGGTFTISNLGMFGIQSFAAVINPPQACILAVGGTESKVVVNENSEDQFSVANVMNVTLSCDHRVVDGAVGAQWLKEFKSYIEDPITLLL